MLNAGLTNLPVLSLACARVWASNIVLAVRL